MSKTHKVINSCKTLKQLRNSWNYVLLSYANHQDLYTFQTDADVYRDKIRRMTGAICRNVLDYTEYAKYLYQNGNTPDAMEFIKFSELELHKIESLQYD